MTRKIFTPFITIVGLTFFGCVMCGPFPQDYTCDIKASKTFNIPLSKADIFKNHLTYTHGYSSNYKINLTDSMFYIHCPANEPESDAIFECKVVSINDASTLIETYRVDRFSIIADKELENYYTNLSSDSYLKMFTDNFVSHLKKGDTHRKFAQDNKKAYDEWQTNDQHILDSLDKAYKKRDATM